MLVSHRKRFIYIKTVKTAGTSVEMALQRYCLPEGAEPPAGRDGLETAAGIIGARGGAAGPDGGQRWYNHMPAREIRRNLPESVWNGYCKICNIRNPWDKTVSWFHFRHPRIKDRPRDEIIAAFREFLRPDEDGRLQIGRDTHIYFIGGRPVADEYIRYETLEADLQRVCRRLGLEIAALPRAKTAQRGRNRIPYQEYYDEASRQRIAEIYAREIAHFGWTFD